MDLTTVGSSAVPFCGRKSTPAVPSVDLIAAVGFFDTFHNDFRQLREFRKIFQVFVYLQSVSA